MKISGAVIQNRFIKVNTANEFVATYKGHRINISNDHKLGKPKYSHLTRFDIVVFGKDGGYAVNAYEDFHEIKDAIRYALKGACLLPE
jgi:hypothetical protein